MAGPLPAIAYTEQDAKYQGAPIPSNEKERHAYLCALNLLDTPPDPRFDNITQLACLAFKASAERSSGHTGSRECGAEALCSAVQTATHEARYALLCAWGPSCRSQSR